MRARRRAGTYSNLSQAGLRKLPDGVEGEGVQVPMLLIRVLCVIVDRPLHVDRGCQT